jgi:multidrug efflux system membrane fusion protein
MGERGPAGAGGPWGQKVNGGDWAGKRAQGDGTGANARANAAPGAPAAPSATKTDNSAAAAGSRRAAGKPGAPMQVTAFDRTRTITLDTGVFASLDNQVDTTTGTVKAKAQFANSQLNLFPNQFVNVQLLLKVNPNAVAVPVSALRHSSNGDYVYVLNAADRSVSQRPVKAGQATVDKVTIVSGLEAGEVVITEGADRLKDGSKVTLAGDAGGAGGAAGGQRRGAEGGGRPGGRGPRPGASAPTEAAAPVGGASDAKK